MHRLCEEGGPDFRAELQSLAAGTVLAHGLSISRPGPLPTHNNHTLLQSLFVFSPFRRLCAELPYQAVLHQQMLHYRSLLEDWNAGLQAGVGRVSGVPSSAAKESAWHQRWGNASVWGQRGRMTLSLPSCERCARRGQVLVDRATTPGPRAPRGQILLASGGSGSVQISPAPGHGIVC